MYKNIRTICKGLFLYITLSLTFNFSFAQPDGKALFKVNCARCHSITSDLVGPALRDVNKRIPGKKWFINWVRNSKNVIQSKEEYANDIYNKWNKVEMAKFPDMSEDDILAIFDYFILESEAIATAEASTKLSILTTKDPNRILKALLVLVIILFIILLFALSKVVFNLGNLISTKENHPFNKLIKILKKIRKKRVQTLIVSIVFLFLCVITYKGASNLGLQQDYQPEQPIGFSHKTHAGINKIDCKYCHAGVEKSKLAGIPSVNICLNCHKALQYYQGKAFNGKEGATEIKKILDTYKNNEPIKWVKVHNLPDHVFFSHAQHVKVGQVECNTCHGIVEEMDEIKQFAPLSMGWCVNCHRDTKVQFETNEYYNIFEELHNNLKAGNIDSVLVDKIGGIDCQKCHY